ncbi:hypothetical protein JRO89_XS01G0309800 [Xanthoceras sorbifolium]|uniref:Thioesterase domain-containing protein n=1 Tax=Xanthoceras sorbifolium TaxID=99658 RepID=A0ABQ8IP35_9ROSI|nr:hypothetical protein JRO89_XS01G0309800 [Xanthoceras sorbifolium]
MAAPPSSTTTGVIAKDVDRKCVETVVGFLQRVGSSSYIPDNMSTKDFYSNVVGVHLKVHQIQRGRVTCFFSVKPAVANAYGGVHGGAVGAIAERMAIACARTVVSEDREIFLAELSLSYLYAAPKNFAAFAMWFSVPETQSVLIVDASVSRSGKTVTVVAVDFKFKESGKVYYSCHATFFNMPVAKL